MSTDTVREGVACVSTEGGTVHPSRMGEVFSCLEF